MDQFPVQGGQLLVGGERLSTLVARVGQTPFYVYDRAVLQARMAALRNELPATLKIHYAIKANPMPALVGFMAGLVDGLDVASAGELKVALDAGVCPREISFAGPGKRVSELRQAVAARVLINLESFREVAVLEEISNALGLAARVAVRINPDFELKSSGMRMGGGPKPFGVDAEEVPRLLQRLSKTGLQFEGFHLYAGSQNLNAQALCEAQNKAYELILRLGDKAPSPVLSLNLGGGFGIPYFAGETRLDVAQVGDNLSQLSQRAQTDFPHASLVIELGRYLVGEAGLYVARIVDRKVSRGHVFLVVDGGLHQHLSASGNFGQVIRKNYPLTIGNRQDAPAFETVSVVGPLCTPLDVVADHMVLPESQVDDWVVVYQSGAYGASASPQNFLGHPPCVEVLV
jgi:diaminopimelate decarboxylase